VQLLSPCEVNAMDSPSRFLAFHGAIVLLVGLLCGAFYGMAIQRGSDDKIVQRWRVAHASLPIGAMLMFAVAGLLPVLSSPRACQWLVAYSLIVSAYAFCVAQTLAGHTGQRGLAFGKSPAAHVVYLGNVLGAVASLIAALALIYAGFFSLQ